MNYKFQIMVSILFLLVGCSNHQTYQPLPASNVIETNLSRVSAEFTTRVYGAGKDGIRRSRLSRSPERIEWFDVDANTSELWTKTSQNLWFYSKVFHSDQQIIEYSPLDLNLLQAAPAWQSFAAAINPELLRSLGEMRALNALDGFKRTQYRGTLGQINYEVDWLPELSLASRVKMVEQGRTQVTELSRPFVTSDDTKVQHNISRYRIIEYSDLGDMERDPFVIKVQQSLLGTHDHPH